MRWEIAQAIPEADPLAVGQIELYLLTLPSYMVRVETLLGIFKSRGTKVSGPSLYPELVSPIAALENLAQLDDVVREVLAACFWDAERGPLPALPDRDICGIADLLGIDLAAAWRDHQAGPMSEAYWNHKSKDELLKLAHELKVKLTAIQHKKPYLVAALNQPGKVTAMPREIAKLKAPK